jgi:hypothetical protein
VLVFLPGQIAIFYQTYTRHASGVVWDRVTTPPALTQFTSDYPMIPATAPADVRVH